MPMRFHPKYHDKIQSTGFGSCSQTIVSGYKGFAALDFKLTQKAEWQFIFHDLSYKAEIGVCQIPNELQQGTNGWKSFHLIGFNQQVGDFKFDQTNLVKFTYYPSGYLQYFNTNTRKSCTIKLQPKLQGYQYYPIVNIYKATVTIWNQPLIQLKRKKILKENKKK